MVTHPSHRRYDAEWEIEWALEGMDYTIIESDYYGVLLVDISSEKVLDAFQSIKDFETTSIFHVIPLNYVVDSNISDIKSVAVKLCDGISEVDKFAVRCNRRGNKLDSSKEVERKVGALVVEETNAEVDLEDPDFYVNIEVLGSKTGVGLSEERLRKTTK